MVNDGAVTKNAFVDAMNCSEVKRNDNKSFMTVYSTSIITFWLFSF